MTAQLELVHPIPTEPADDSDARADHHAIALMIPEGASVLDLGCGDGGLISLLISDRDARARGIDIDPGKVHACVRRGLSVVQGDAERDLGEIPSGAFDYVVLSHVLQRLNRPHEVLKQAARIGDRVIVSIRNASHWRARLQLMGRGRMGSWEGDVQRPTTVRDFAELAADMRLKIERATPISRGNPGAPFARTLWRANWFAEEAVFVLAP